MVHARVRQGLHLLVAAEDVPDVGGARQRLVNLHGRATRICEHGVHAFSLESLDQNVATFPCLAIEAVHPACSGVVVTVLASSTDPSSSQGMRGCVTHLQ